MIKTQKKNVVILLFIIFSFLLCGITSWQFDRFEPLNPSERNLLLKDGLIEYWLRLLNETRANAYTTNNQQSASICTLSNNSVAVAWASYGQDGDGYGIYARVFDVNTGNNITVEFRVNEDTTYSQYTPSICALSSDIVVIAWRDTQQDSLGCDVAARVFNATTGNSLTPEFRLNAYTTRTQMDVSICALSSDTFVAAWMSDDQDGSGEGVYANVFNAKTGNSTIAEFRVNEYTTDHQYAPSICALSSDTFAVTWMSNEQDGSGYGIYARVFNATTGNSITPEFRVNDYVIDDQHEPSICMLSSDSVAIAWTSNGQDGSGNGVYARVFNMTTGYNMTVEILVNENTTNHQTLGQINKLSSDTFVVAWTSYLQDGSGDAVYAKVFNATTGNRLTPEFQVNTYTESGQKNPSICALSYDSVAVAWQSYGQDGDGVGIYFSVFGLDIYAPTVSIVNPTTGIYGPPSLLINASISDHRSHVTGVKVMINAIIPFNITMFNPSGNYWVCLWNNISLYSNGYYKLTIWAVDNARNVNQRQFVIIYLTTDAFIPGYDSIILLCSIMGIILIAIRKYMKKSI